MQRSWQLPKNLRFLLEVNIDAPEKNGRAGALVLLFQSHWQIKRDHGDRMRLLSQRPHQRIITETVSAIHSARAWCNVNDIQGSILLSPSNRWLENFTPVKRGCITFCCRLRRPWEIPPYPAAAPANI